MKSFRSPSLANIWTQCSAFPSLAEQTVDLGKDSDARILGTEAHASVVALNETGDIDSHTDEFARPFLDLVRQDGAQYGVETDFTCSWLSNRTQEQGVVDAWSISKDGRTLTAFELKTGHYPVPARHNMQTLIAGLTISQWFASVTEIKNVVFQPRNFVTRGPVSEWTASKDTWQDWVRTSQKAYEETFSNRIYRTGEHCLTCFAKYRCPAFQRQISLILDIEIPYSEGVCSDAAIGVELTTLKTAERRIKKRIDAVSDLATNRLQRGNPVLGWTLATGRTQRYWVAPEAARYVLEQCGIDPRSNKIISPAVAESKGLKPEITEGLTERRGRPTLTPITRPDNLEIKK
jgi:hypothetical protein